MFLAWISYYIQIIKWWFSCCIIPSTFVKCDSSYRTASLSHIPQPITMDLLVPFFPPMCFNLSMSFFLTLKLCPGQQFFSPASIFIVAVLVYLWAFLCFFGITHSRLILYLWQTWNQSLLQGTPIPFSGEWYLKTKIWVLSVFVVNIFRPFNHEFILKPHYLVFILNQLYWGIIYNKRYSL